MWQAVPLYGTTVSLYSEQMPLVYALVAKITLRARSDPRGVSMTLLQPPPACLTAVTGVLVWRLTLPWRTNLARSWETNLYGQNEQAGVLTATLAPFNEVTWDPSEPNPTEVDHAYLLDHVLVN